MWLIALALTSQVVGWLLISVSLGGCRRRWTSVLLTLQPLLAVLFAAGWSTNGLRPSSWSAPLHPGRPDHRVGRAAAAGAARGRARALVHFRHSRRRTALLDSAAWRRRPSSTTPAPSAATRPGAGSAGARAAASFGTLVEEAAAGRERATPLRHAAAPAGRRLGRGGRADPDGCRELDRVLGGGLVPASLVLVGGEPGVGKSTLLLMALAAISRERRALLVTGEESTAQVKLRAARLGGAEQRRDPRRDGARPVCATLEAERPDVCVIDSVQTLYSAEVGSAPGSVAQVREAAARLLRVAKEAGVAMFLVGHVTKDGSVAGPRVLEHLVDCVLQFEGDRYHAHRVLRAAKNRFGSTNELGVFEMTGAGLVGVPDPSELFGRSTGEVGAAVACALEGTRPLLLEIQALVAPTDLAMPRRVGTGVDPKRLAMIVAVLSRHAGVSLGQADVFVNVAGGVRIDEPGADLGIALAIASAARGAPVRERHRRLRRDRADRSPAARDPGRAAAGGVREVRRHASSFPRARKRRGEDPRVRGRHAAPGGGGRSRARGAADATALSRDFSRKGLENWPFQATFVILRSRSPAGLPAGGLAKTRQRGGGRACTRSATRWCTRTTGQAPS